MELVCTSAGAGAQYVEQVEITIVITLVMIFVFESLLSFRLLCLLVIKCHYCNLIYLSHCYILSQYIWTKSEVRMETVLPGDL